MAARKVTAIIGEPASGKSTLMREIIRQLQPMEFYKPKWLPRHTNFERRVTVLGDYSDNGQQFPGTDRMSMGVMPHVLPYLAATSDAVMWEGARLCSAKLFENLFNAYGNNFLLCLVTVGEQELNRRRAAERVQTDSFLKAKRTQIQNIERQFQGRITYISGGTNLLSEAATWLICQSISNG